MPRVAPSGGAALQRCDSSWRHERYGLITTAAWIAWRLSASVPTGDDSRK